MKIGVYISPSHSVPPNEKNILAPWVLVHQLADGLIDKGHQVVLFAAKDSKTKAKLVHGGIESTVQKLKEFGDPDAYRSYVVAQELALMREVIIYAKAGKLDIIHIHQPVERLYPALLAMPAHVPVIVTFHDPISPERFAALEKLVGLGNIHFVSLSKSQQKGVPFPFSGVVPNGVDTKLFKPDGENLHGLLITGRIVPQKGFLDAIEAAKQAKVRLMMVGQPYGEYFEKEIQSMIDGKTVIWESVVKQDHLVGHYQTAKALLFPIHWEEPFGLVMIEAMACGTPVIAYNHGSVSEIVRDGMNGFIIENNESTKIQASNNKQISNSKFQIKKIGIDGLVEAIRRIGEIDRSACRKHVAQHFSLNAMIEGYEGIYASLIRHQ